MISRTCGLTIRSYIIIRGELTMRNGFKIIDTDCHLMEPEWLWERYTETAFRIVRRKMAPARLNRIGALPGGRANRSA